MDQWPNEWPNEWTDGPNGVDVPAAGCTFKPLGLYAGQRYEVRSLFWRRRRRRRRRLSASTPTMEGEGEGEGGAATTAWDEAAEMAARIPAASVDESPPSSGDTDDDDHEYELCAELYNPTWTPWGSSEVAVAVGTCVDSLHTHSFSRVEQGLIEQGQNTCQTRVKFLAGGERW